MREVETTMRKCILAAVMAAGLALFSGSRADAAFQVKITVTFAGVDTSVVITDGGGTDNNVLPNFISFSDIFIQGYQFSGNAQATQSASGALVTDQTLSVDTLTGAAAGLITIQTLRDDFTFAGVGSTVLATSSISSTRLENGDVARVVSNINGTLSPVVTLTGPVPPNNGFQEVDFSAQIASNPFAISNTLTIEGLANFPASANITASTEARLEGNVIPVPPALLLVVSGLPVAGVMFLRRRKPA
jgi:hypothetical protein